MQPGEDALSGGWLPAPDTNGIRTVETNFFYDAAEDAPQTLIIRLETSSWPGLPCIYQESFTLEPCPCDVDVTLEVRDANGVEPPPGCLPPGTYTVALTSPDPATSDVQWQVNNEVREVTGTTLDVTLQAEDSVLVAVRANRGECDDQAAVTLQNCLETDTQFFPCSMLSMR